MSAANVSPTTFLGGTWEPIQDTFLLAAGSSYTAGSTGGSADSIIPYHNHTATGGAVGDKAAFNTGNQSANHTHNFTSYKSGGAYNGSGNHYNPIYTEAGTATSKQEIIITIILTKFQHMVTLLLNLQLAMQVKTLMVLHHQQIIQPMLICHRTLLSICGNAQLNKNYKRDIS